MATKKKFYITTAIDYVNSKPHLGHAYEKVAADALARWHRMKGEDVFFLTGTDENAQKNEKAAKEAGKPTKAFVDENTQLFIGLCKALNISYDYFIRTTEKSHMEAAQRFFSLIHKNGDIYKGNYEGLYCIGCEAFLTEKELVNGKCPEHNREPQFLREENYFFRMGKYKGRLLKFLETGKFIIPKERAHEIINRLNSEELKDLCVSRKGLNWGIKTPIDKGHTIYVWMDALFNYISALGYPNGPKMKKYWPADMHIIGKGISWFHSVIWPALLFSAGIEQPKKLGVHGYITVEGQKMSKTIGNVVDPLEIASKYGVDQFRYFLLREMPFNSDGDFSERALKARINGELASDFGNLVSRVLTLVERFDGKIGGNIELDKFLDLDSLEKNMDNLEFHIYLENVWKFIRAANKYITEKEPWKMQDKKELGKVLYNLLEAARIAAILVWPAMPEAAEKINKQLGLPAKFFLKDAVFGKGKYPVKPAKGAHLFERVV